MGVTEAAAKLASWVKTRVKRGSGYATSAHQFLQRVLRYGA